jgi:cardiolipin synthase
VVKRSGLGRVWTAPNAISLGRLVLVACFSTLIFATDDRVGAAIVIAVAGSTDFFDGYVARRFNQVSTIGQILDPTVDRVVLATAVVSLVIYGAIPPWLVGVVMLREATISVAALILASRHAEPIPVSWIGKTGTFGLMCVLPLFLFGDGGGSAERVVSDIAWAITVPSLAFAYAAVVSYASPALSSLSRARAASLGTKA